MQTLSIALVNIEGNLALQKLLTIACGTNGQRHNDNEGWCRMVSSIAIFVIYRDA